jgi:hypothetical protein
MLIKEKYKSGLKSKSESLLKKIKSVLAKKPNAVKIKKGNKLYLSEKLVSLTINETAPTNTISFDDGSGAQNYDLADILFIKRIRTRKWLIVIKDNANPA